MAASLRANTLFEQIIREEYYKEKTKQQLISETSLADAANSQQQSTSKPGQSKADVLASVPKMDSRNKDSMSKISGVSLPKPANVPKITSKLMTSTSFDPNFKPKKKWVASDAEELLKKMGAKPYASYGDNHKYELVLIQGSEATDRLQFEDDYSVWSGNYMGSLNWSVSPNGKSLTIFVSTPLGKTNLGTIEPRSGKAYWVINPELAKKISTEKEAHKSEEPGITQKGKNARIDKFQGVLDWVGIVPVVGDFIDLVNGCVYAYRGKWFDAIFSWIAIIPVFGSAAALTAKTGKKAALEAATRISKLPGIRNFDDIERILAKGDNAELAQLWKSWFNNKLFKKGQEKIVIDVFNKILRGLRNPSTLKKIKSHFKVLFFKGAIKTAEEEFDEAVETAAEFLTRNVDALKLSTKTNREIARKEFKDLVGDAVEATDPTEIIAKMVGKGFLKSGYTQIVWKDFKNKGVKKWVMNKLAKFTNLLYQRPAIREGIVKSMAAKFLKQWGKQPEDYAKLMLSTAVPIEAFVKDVVDNILSKNKEVIAQYATYVMKDAGAETAKVIKHMRQNLFKVPADLTLKAAKAGNYTIQSIAGTFAKLAAVGPKGAAAVTEIYSKVLMDAVEKGNPYFLSYAEKASVQFLSYFTRAGSAKNIKNQLQKELLEGVFSVRKKLDIFASEIEDIIEYFHTVISPAEYYGEDAGLKSIPATTVYDQNGKPLLDNPISSLARSFAYWFSDTWKSFSDDEKNGFIFETFAQPVAEEWRTGKIQQILNSEQGHLLKQYIKRKVETEKAPVSVILKGTLGWDTGMGSKLADTGGYNPAKRDSVVPNQKKYPIGYEIK